MIIQIVSTAEQADPRELKGKTVVVLDILRATTNIVSALANGCKEIVPALTIEEALSLAEKMEKNTFLLGGERKRKQITGFDLGNSPLEYKTETVSNKIIILTTTNGTKAIMQASLARNVLIGSLLNGAAVAEYCLYLDADLVILCAGTKGLFSLEDSIAAGYLVDYLVGKNITVQLDDLAIALRELYKNYSGRILEPLALSENGRSLLAMGRKADLDFAAQVNLYQIVPLFRQGKIKLISWQ